jgi:hypothetical protein
MPKGYLITVSYVYEIDDKTAFSNKLNTMKNERALWQNKREITKYNSVTFYY